MKIFTKEIMRKLIKNNEGDKYGFDKKPVVKLFNPTGIGTWYLYCLDEKTNIAYGVADLFEKEYGVIDVDELLEYRHASGLGIERDMYWSADKTCKQIIQER
jgi:hypothetical protein